MELEVSTGNLPTRQGELAEMIAQFVRFAQVRRSSAGTYLRSLRRFASWLNEQGLRPDQLTREDVLNYRAHLEGSGISPLTVAAYLTAVKCFLAYLEEATDGRVRNVADKVKSPRRQRGFRKAGLTVEQARRLLALVEREGRGIRGLRDKALLTLLIATGLRSIESCRADVGSLTTEGGKTVLYVHGKGRDLADEFVLIEPAVEAVLREYLAARGAVKSTEPLLAGHCNRNNRGRLTTSAVRRIVTGWLVRAGLKTDRISTHSLRHTAALTALEAGSPVEKIQAMLRHENISTTMVYLKSRDRLRDGAESAVAGLLFGV